MQPPGDPDDSLQTRPAPPGSHELEARFQAAWTTAHNAVGADPMLMPDQLAAACVTVLPIDGAGLSLVEGRFRIPLGASDTAAAFAEQLQFTQGEGPCLDAASDRSTIAVGENEIERRWPQFADEMLSHTPYHAVISVPLALNRDATGALDMFLINEADLEEVRLAEAARVAAAIVDALHGPDEASIDDPWSPPNFPLWLTGPRVQNRQRVWVAAGMVMEQFHADAADALARLRAYAYSRDSTLDAVAAGIVNGGIGLGNLQS